MRRGFIHLCISALILVSFPSLWAARGTTSASNSNGIVNTSYGPLASSNGPFTIAFWFKSGNINPAPSYLVEAGRAGSQWAVIYGYTSGQIEFYDGNATVRQNTGITIPDTNWHHIAYRLNASGVAQWDKFLDGVKTSINTSISFTLPATNGDFFTFIADNFQAPCVCSMGDVVVYNSALADATIQGLAAGNRPSLTPTPLVYWPLAGTSNPEPDASGNNHPGTVDGSVIQVPDPPYSSGTSVGISVSPTSASLSVNQAQPFTATVTGSSNTAVTWSVSPSVGTVTTGGLYTAPSSISSSQTVTVTATSAADATKSASATVTLTPVTITVSPTSATLSAGQTQPFTSTVTGSSNTGVTWSVSPSVGTVTTGGVYTAPSSISSSQTVTVTATSAADATRSASATVTLTPVTITVSPTSATLSAGQTQPFTSTVTGSSNTGVTWSVSPATGAGTVTTGGLYTAPSSISSQTVTVTATSAADATKTASATVTLTAGSAGPSTARGTTSASRSNSVQNTSYMPLSGSAGPFTIAFWFQSGTVNPGQTYILEGGHSNAQWAVIYGFTPGQIEFFDGNAAVRQGTGIPISDTNWHHIAYRLNASGVTEWDRFLDGVKTATNTSISFTLPSSTGFYAFNADNSAAPCWCSLGDVAIYNSALPDAAIQGLAAGNHPGSSPAPVLYWPLLGTSNPEPDASGNNHPGTVVGSVVQVPGPPYSGGQTPVTISVSPTSASLSAGQTQPFTGTVTGSSNTTINWSLSPNVGTVSSSGLYTAPASISSAQTITLTATSAADTTKTATATITLSPVSITVSPTGVLLTAGQNQPFTATVSGSSNTAVTWALSPSTGAGTVTGSGLYTAPASISSTQIVTLTATSVADTTRSASATITLSATGALPTSNNGTVARGASTVASANVIENLSYGPLSASSGPFTIAFWFQSGNVNPAPSYIAEGFGGGGQWAIVYGYTAKQIQFYTGGSLMQNTGITIADTNWHHIAYRKDAAGASSWNMFLDGVKTVINPSISFSLPSVSSFYLLNADNSLSPCQCGVGDVAIYNSALPDGEVQALAAGNRPGFIADPQLYWPLSGTSAQEPDASGNNHAGTVLGSIQPVAGPPYLPPAGRSISTGAATNSVIKNTSFGPLSSSNGPFTVAFWFQSLNTNPASSYILQAYTSGPNQWGVIYGFTSQEIEFFTGSAAVRQNSGITITDGNWHHIAYRKSASGSSSWDRFLDGVKTNINPSINFTLPAVGSFYAFNSAAGSTLCNCSLADIALYNTALADTEVQSLAQGARPPALNESPILYWPLTGSALEPDYSGNNNPGTIVGNLSTANPPPYAGEVTVAPASAQVLPTGSQQFTATVSGGNSNVTWFLNPQLGNISPAGLYTAPASIAAPTSVTITATVNAYPTLYDTATVVVTSGAPPPTPGAILSSQYDTNRTSSNPNETILTTANVNVNQFGKLFSLPVDGYVYAQPLYVPASLVPGLGQNTVFVASMNNTLYAFNADTGAHVWSFSLGAAQGAGYGFLAPEVGIVSTPVIDPTRKVIYVVGRNSDGYRIHAIDLIAHTEKAGSPVLIQGSVAGPNGYDAVNGVITFNPSQEIQRPGLLLANNTVYVAFGSIMDVDPWHGWFFGYNADTLAQTVMCVTPNGGQGGLWMSGGAPAVDSLATLPGYRQWQLGRSFKLLGQFHEAESHVSSARLVYSREPGSPYRERCRFRVNPGHAFAFHKLRDRRRQGRFTLALEPDDRPNGTFPGRIWKSSGCADLPSHYESCSDR